MIFICLSYINYEGIDIGPIFTDEKDAISWTMLCEKLKNKKHQLRLQEKYDEAEEVNAQMKQIQASEFADDYGYIRRIPNKLLIRGKMLE